MIKKRIITVASMLMMCFSIAGGCSSGVMAVADDIMARTGVTLEIARTQGFRAAAQSAAETSHFIVARWMGRLVDVSFDGPNGARRDIHGNESVPVIVPYNQDPAVWKERIYTAADGFVKLHIPYRLANIAKPI